MTDISATPAKHEDVEILLKNGIKTLYSHVVFFPKAKILLFNGANSSATIEPENIAKVVVCHTDYSILQAHKTDTGVWQVNLEPYS